MSLNNATKMQFMERSSSYATRPSRRGANLLGWVEEENMTPEQERDCLVSKWKRVQEELLLYPKKHPERKRLGICMQEIQDQINAIRPKAKAPGIENFVIDVLKEEMTHFEFNRVINKAKKKMAENAERLKSLQSELGL